MRRSAHDYGRDVDFAAMEVVSELDDTDGVVVDTPEYRHLVRQKAAAYGVRVKDVLDVLKEML